MDLTFLYRPPCRVEVFNQFLLGFCNCGRTPHHSHVFFIYTYIIFFITKKKKIDILQAKDNEEKRRKPAKGRSP